MSLLLAGFLIFGTFFNAAKSACVTPAKTLPLAAYTFRPSTLQIFTALNLSCGGFVTGWRVVLTSSYHLPRISGVYLGIFRQLTASKFQLMGITEVNFIAPSPNSSDFSTMTTTSRTGWEIIPARPQFPVQRGDVVGIFYKRWFIPEREVAIPVAGEQHVPPMSPPTYVAMKDWYDISETLQNGGVLSMGEAGTVQRLPAVQVLVNVGICGNSRLEDAEECDDSNTADGDGCNCLCRNENEAIKAAGLMNVCGNGVVEAPAEECDDGNRINGDGCSAKCAVEEASGPMCGNGKREPGEQCDDGNNNDNDGCSVECRSELISSICGNRVLEFGEQCDDGNTLNSDGCNSKCMLEGIGICGDSTLDPTEECDDGNKVNGDSCSANCTKEICGNGIQDANEECDDGNVDSRDGCSSDCKLELCGNGILQEKEQCDDGNKLSGDGCSPECTLEFCGNGVIDGTEQCDDGNTRPGDGCGPLCMPETCGNGVIEIDEECDDGNLDAGDGCSVICRRETCGNGYLDPPYEDCDDGNNLDDDGCSNSCKFKDFGLFKIKDADEMASFEGDGQGISASSPSSSQITPLLNVLPGLDLEGMADGETVALGGDLIEESLQLGSSGGAIALGGKAMAAGNNNILLRQRSASRSVVGRNFKQEWPSLRHNKQPTAVEPVRMRKTTGKRQQPNLENMFIPPIVVSSSAPLSDVSTINTNTDTEETTTTTTSTTTITPATLQPFLFQRIGNDLAPVDEDEPWKTIQYHPNIAPDCAVAPMLGGVCRQEPLVRWFYNSLTSRCDWFYDQSCYAGSNYFETKAECMITCGLLASEQADAVLAAIFSQKLPTAAKTITVPPTNFGG